MANVRGHLGSAGSLTQVSVIEIVIIKCESVMAVVMFSSRVCVEQCVGEVQ